MTNEGNVQEQIIHPFHMRLTQSASITSETTRILTGTGSPISCPFLRFSYCGLLDQRDFAKVKPANPSTFSQLEKEYGQPTAIMQQGSP